MRTLGWRPCETTLASTVAPATSGAPIDSSAPLPIGEDLVERDSLADVGGEPLDLDRFAGGDPVLLAAGFDDRVHLISFVRGLGQELRMPGRARER